ncbi:MAG: LamG domain-containing protein, partial [Elusimicrobiota bacterium]
MGTAKLRRIGQQDDCVLSINTGDISELEKKYEVVGDKNTEDSRFGKSMVFDGDGDYINCGTNSEFNVSDDDFTISAWFKTNSSDTQFVVGKGSIGDGGKRYKMEIQSDKVQMEIDDDTDFKQVSGTTEVTDNEWHLGVIKREGDTFYVYVDGTEENSNTYEDYGSLDDETKPFTVGISSDDLTTLDFDGSIDEVMIFNRSLSESEIERLYKQSLFDYEKDVVGYWRLNSTGTITDLSPYGNDGTVEGNPTLDNSYIGGRECLSFDGDGDYVEVPDDESISVGGGNMTASLWIKFKDNSGSHIFLGKSLNAADKEYVLRLDNDQEFQWLSEKDDSNDEVKTSGVNVQEDRWYHVTYVKNDLNVSIYVDGSFNNDGLLSTNPDYFDSDLHIGKQTYGTATFNGSIDEVMVFNRSLSESEIQNIYNNQSARFKEQGYTNLKHQYYNTSYNSFNITTDTAEYFNTNVSNLKVSTWEKEDGYFNYDLGDSELKLDGDGDYVDIEKTDELTFNNSIFSVSVWFKTSVKENRG